MKSGKYIAFVVIAMLALLVSTAPGCGTTPVGAGPISTYLAVVPKSLQSGGAESISVALFGATGGLTAGRVEVALTSDSGELTKSTKSINGKGTIDLDIPDVEEGQYTITIKGEGFEDSAPIRIARSSLIFLETDKPIYKPGQTIHMRAITLDRDLKPETLPVTVEVLDAKGIKVFRDEVTTDDYGMIKLDLPLSTEPNLGVWKINASTNKAETQVDVRVEEYVLPKYEVKADLPRDWFLVSEQVTGTISSEYSFGKPVKGQLVISAKKYVGEWEEYATVNKQIDGDTDFTIPAAGYVAGVPAAGGQGNVILDITVRETATGYEESTSVMLTVAGSSLNIQLIPESPVFKPGLPYHMLMITETPDNQPQDAEVDVAITYYDDDLGQLDRVDAQYTTANGKALIEVTPPASAVAMEIEAASGRASTFKAVEAGYSPSGNFIHLEQTSDGIPEVGERIQFKVYFTDEAVNFYYEVVARDRVVFTDFTRSHTISFVTTPQMAPSAKLLVYQILPNSEVAADYLPFEVSAQYPQDVEVGFSEEEARPGDAVRVTVRAEGQSKVGLVAVDRSVFILAENRLNLQQVFDALEALYMQPQAELHEFSIWEGINIRGARETFDDAGVVVLSNSEVPEGKEIGGWGGGIADGWLRAFGGQMEADAVVPVPMGPPGPDGAKSGNGGGLAEVERIRQFFPETWIWEDITTDGDGRGTLDVEVPDSITTWMLRAVAVSKDRGLGVGEAQLKAFQPFFVKVDLPYSAIRGEEFPVSIAVYNYLDEPQEVFVEFDEADWFDLLDDSAKSVVVPANEVGGVEFMIRPTELGTNEVQLTARSTEAADAVIKKLIVIPEGIAREVVENLSLSAGVSKSVSTDVPAVIVDGSGRAYIAVTSSFLTQTIEGLEGLLQMPFGCGEQNMIVFAPDVFITKYLDESGQLKPEIMAKAEKLMITGYQRELTYRHRDGSFSAFGESDDSGSLFLTAFVLKSFAQAKGLIYIDQSILDEAEDWIVGHQNGDGSFDQVGFVCHEEMMGGVQGKTALTAYTAIALLEAGESVASRKALDYLEGELHDIDDAYTIALVSYALELGGSNMAAEAYDMLMEMATADEDGLHWGDIDPLPLEPEQGGIMDRGFPRINRSIAIEATGYGTLALLEHGDRFNASRAAKWLVSQRNANGGFGSTQDTVVGLQALIQYSTDTRADVDLTVTVDAAGQETVLRIAQENYDVLQVVEVPIDADVDIDVSGDGEAIAQVVKRYNVPEVEEGENVFDMEVDYDTTRVEVNDLIEVSVSIEFNPPIEGTAEMVVLDVSVPTGFAPVSESIEDVVGSRDNIKRYDIAGRKVIFYIEDMDPGDEVEFSFDARALYPVKAKPAVSQAFSYYEPELKGETLSLAVEVTGS